MQSLIPFQRQDFTITTSPEALAARDEAIAQASLVQVVRDKLTRDAAVEAQKALKTQLKAAEDCRTTLKAPILQLGKRLDATAAEFAQPLQTEYARLDYAVCEYETEQREIARRLEEARQREIEAERRRLEEEARAAERARIIAEEAKRREIEEAQRQALEAKTAAARKAAAAEAERLAIAAEAQRKIDEARRAEEDKARQETMAQKSAEFGPPSAPALAEGQSVRETWDFELQDIHRLYLSRGQQCVKLEVKRAEILSLINGGGVREIPGLRIFKVVKSRVAVGQQQKLIDV